MTTAKHSPSYFKDKDTGEHYQLHELRECVNNKCVFRYLTPTNDRHCPGKLAVLWVPTQDRKTYQCLNNVIPISGTLPLLTEKTTTIKPSNNKPIFSFYEC